MPWGERVGYVTDPEGNVVSLATAAGLAAPAAQRRKRSPSSAAPELGVPDARSPGASHRFALPDRRGGADGGSRSSARLKRASSGTAAG